MNKIINQILINNFNVELNKRKVQIDIKKLPEAIGDSLLITEVWENLLSNAFKFTAKCEDANINIGFKRENNHTVYFVCDNGVGFDQESSVNLFQPFQRFHLDNEFEGSGIGLAFVKSIITKHGGNIWINSQINNGTTVYFYLS